ncbi:IS5/IS1182 family transposase, partial [Staphylococcus edaphicus]
FSKNYTRRFHDTDLFEQIFEKILEIAIKNNLIDHSSLFIDSTYIKANANKNKYIKKIVKKDALQFQEELDNEINEQRRAQGKSQ